jgi:Protein of unknown function (DUF1214)
VLIASHTAFLDGFPLFLRPGVRQRTRREQMSVEKLHRVEQLALDAVLATDDSPGKQKESNWLPAPEGPFNITLRMYWPKEAVLDGSWKPPAIQKVAGNAKETTLH